jgi:uncharacterized membrane protein YgaE (UPF0421/DUF939 family)
MGKMKMEKKKQMENKALLIWKMALASALSWEIAKIAGSHHPYLAPISVILCLQTTVNKSIRFSYHRMVGTVIGISVTVLVARHLDVNGWTLGLLILVAGFITKWLKRDETALHQVALTVLLVFSFEYKAGSYPIDRFRDTLIGALIAVLIQMIIFPPNFIKQADRSLQKFRNHLSSTFSKVSNWVKSGVEKGEGYQLEGEVKTLLDELHQMKKTLQDASDSLKYNPFGKKSMKKLQNDQQKVHFLNQGYTYLSSIVGIFSAWSKAGTISPLQMEVWADQIQTLSLLFKKENPAEWIQPGGLLKITLPTELEKQKHHITLYHDTVQLLEKISKNSS